MLEAADKIDFDRMTPVPAGEPIPIMDFFRTELFFQPRLNPSGTHITALVSAGADRVGVIIYDLDTKKMENLYGLGDRDISTPFWLDDKRVIIGVSTDKHWFECIFAANVGRLGDCFPLVQYCSVRPVGIPDKNPLRPLFWIRSDLPDEKDRGVYAINTAVNSGPMIELRGRGGGQRGVVRGDGCPGEERAAPCMGIPQA